MPVKSSCRHAMFSFTQKRMVASHEAAIRSYLSIHGVCIFLYKNIGNSQKILSYHSTIFKRRTTQHHVFGCTIPAKLQEYILCQTEFHMIGCPHNAGKSDRHEHLSSQNLRPLKGIDRQSKIAASSSSGWRKGLPLMRTARPCSKPARPQWKTK